MNILVTGGTGFTGSALVLRLLGKGHAVRVLDIQPGLFARELADKGAAITYGSITDRKQVESLTSGMEVVFHLAAAFREVNRSDDFYYDVNVNGTRHVLESAEKFAVTKVVYCSTQGVHGNIDHPPGDEESPIEPVDYYQKTKFQGEQFVRKFIEQGMKATIIRPTAIYGPGDPERFFMIFRRVRKNGSFPMFGDGETFYHPVYISNLVDAFVAAMDPQRGNGEAYLIGDERFVSIRELVEKVAGAMNTPVKINRFPIAPLVIAGHVVEKVCRPFGIAPPIFPRRVDWYRQDRAFTIDKAKTELGYQPKVELEQGLQLTAQWYFQEGYLN